MALFFNLDTLESQAGTDSRKLLALLEYHYTKNPPKSIYTKYKPSKVSLHGYSFLLNPEPLFRDSSTDILYKVQYIKLAARRDYSFFTMYGSKTLQTSSFPDLRYDVIRSNPLLKITPTEIYFKYE